MFAIPPESLRQARDAEAAHLDAVLKINGAKALRLSHLVQSLRQIQATGMQDLELTLKPGEEPHVWLDLSHRVTMEPDTKTYRLSALLTDRVDVLLETENLQEVLQQAQRVLAHRSVKQAWNAAESRQGPKVWSLATLVYVWATGFVAGAAGLALLSIYMKKLPF